MKRASILALKLTRILWLGVAFLCATTGAGEELTNAIHAFLQQRIEIDKGDVGMAVAIVDEAGSHIVYCGKMDAETGQEVDGNTLFDLSFLTKTFTATLLEDEIERGEMKLNDPVAKYLPGSVHLPPRRGKEITLRDLATRSVGLPDAPGLAAFLAPARLEPRPRNLFDSSEMALLGQVLARQTGMDYESLVVERICRPLQMDSTHLILTPELQARSAREYDGNRQPTAGDTGGLIGAVGLHSTANDMVKYISSQLGLTRNKLAAAMEKTQRAYDHDGPFFANGLGWVITRETSGGSVIWVVGYGPDRTAFLGLDPARRRGVAALANSGDTYAVYVLGMDLLQSEWRTERRPQQGKIEKANYDACVGQYQVPPTISLGLLVFKSYFRLSSKTWFFVPVIVWLAVSLFLFWRTNGPRRRYVMAGVVLAPLLFVILAVLALAHMACSLYHPAITIRRAGDRLFAQPALQVNRQAAPLASRLLPGLPAEYWPSIPFELLPESDGRFFNRLTGEPFLFHGQPNARHLEMRNFLGAFSLVKVSD